MAKYGQYGEIAVKAVELCHQGINPRTAWETTADATFGKETSMAKKGCPKSAFLGLCEEGLVEGVAKGVYLNRSNSPNKMYAFKAITLIKRDISLLYNKDKLWPKITEKKYNQQLDVVFALIEKGYVHI